jgi:hypothetical protein
MNTQAESRRSLRRDSCGQKHFLIILLSSIFLSLTQLHAAEPAKPAPPYIAWFEPPLLDSRPELYAGATLITSLVEKHTPLLPRLSAQGTAGLRWAFGPTSAAAEHSRQSAEFYTKQFSPQLLKDGTMAAGVGIDEWNPGDPKFPQERDAAAAGYRAGRKQWPRTFAAAWVTQPDDGFISLLRDGTFDLAIVEGYTFIPDTGGLKLEGIVRRCEPLQRASLLDRTIVCLGYISATPDKRGKVMTFAELERLARAVKQQFPKMPGIAFYGTKDSSPATLELIAKAHALAAELFPRGKAENGDKR